MNYPKYEKKVKALLGDKAYNIFLGAVERGEVDLQQMTDIAVQLHEKVGGNFIKLAKDSRAFQLDRAAARKVLSDWYQHGAYKMDKQAALEKFIAILQHENIQLYPLAAEISSTLTESKTTIILKKGTELIKTLGNCGNSKELIQIESLTDENNKLKGQLSEARSDLAKTNDLNEARQTELMGQISQLQGALDQSEETEKKLRMISHNDEKMLSLLEVLLRQAAAENAGLRHGNEGLSDKNDGLTREIEELTIEVVDMINEIETKEKEILKQKQTIQKQNEVIESLRSKLSLVDSLKEETNNTTIGKFYKNTLNGSTRTILKIEAKNTTPMTKEAATLRRSLDHEHIVKFQESYTEDNGSTHCGDHRHQTKLKHRQCTSVGNVRAEQ